ncbi:hypothetical protein CVT25_005184 [Psilocybe cyanescens]|uniref:Uncharacterized protein n=1 Tax=Psilocybe cyanescens TaxID=93625 RepID=A0A409XBW2_PSICY|nr:hypothetical protein CVT25_005184 [Psilocybe cyanescens]
MRFAALSITVLAAIFSASAFVVSLDARDGNGGGNNGGNRGGNNGGGGGGGGNNGGGFGVSGGGGGGNNEGKNGDGEGYEGGNGGGNNGEGGGGNGGGNNEGGNSNYGGSNGPGNNGGNGYSGNGNGGEFGGGNIWPRTITNVLHLTIAASAPTTNGSRTLGVASASIALVTTINTLGTTLPAPAETLYALHSIMAIQTLGTKCFAT